MWVLFGLLLCMCHTLGWEEILLSFLHFLLSCMLNTASCCCEPWKEGLSRLLDTSACLARVTVRARPERADHVC